MPFCGSLLPLEELAVAAECSWPGSPWKPQRGVQGLGPPGLGYPSRAVGREVDGAVYSESVTGAAYNSPVKWPHLVILRKGPFLPGVPAARTPLTDPTPFWLRL